MSLRAGMATFGEALVAVTRKYRELAHAQEGELRWFAVGCWLRGLGNRDREAITEAFGLGVKGVPRWWDATPSRRDAWFFAMAVEASTPERATLRCLEELVKRFEDQGVRTAQAVRIEAEPLPEDYQPAPPAEGTP